MYKHRLLGWRFNLYRVQYGENDTLEILGPPGSDFLNRKDFTEEQKILLRLIDESSDKSLMKKYSKDKTLVDFFKNLTEEKIDMYIRPAIEVYAAQIVELVRVIGIPVYLREEMKRTLLFPEQKISVLSTNTQCVFHFVKDEIGLRYYISLTHQGNELSLQDKPEVIITNKPAIVLSDNYLHVVDDIESKRLKPFFSKAFISVPPQLEGKYMHDYVLKTFLQYETKMQGIATERTSPEKQAVLFLEEDFNNSLHLLLRFSYGTRLERPASKRATTAWIDEQNIFKIHYFDRDREWESACVNSLLASGLQLKNDDHFYVQQNNDEQPLALIEWLNTHQEELKSFVLQQNIKKVYYTKNIELRSSLTEEMDWFDIHIEVVVDQYVIPFLKFRKHILNNTPEYVLPDGSILVLPSEWFVRYGELFLHSESKGTLIRLKKHHFGLVERIFNQHQDAPKPEWESVAVSDPELADTPLYRLRSYQRAGLRWLLYLHQNRFGGCLADDMGLGKTLQTIALLQYLYKEADSAAAKPAAKAKKKNREAFGQMSLFDEPVKTLPVSDKLPASMVIVPTSLLHNWSNEIKRYAPELKVYIYAGNNRLKTKDIGKIFGHYHLVISSYGTVRNDVEYLSTYLFNYLILDESQYVKNSDSQTYKAVKQLNSSYRLALTGTPIENSLSDLWAQFNFINEGLLGNYSFFQKAYIQPIVKNNNKEVERRLQNLIRPFLLRRTKEEVTPELPPVSQEIIYCDMSEAQQQVYVRERNTLRNNLLGVEKEPGGNKLITLQGLMRLRLLANHPSLALPSYQGDSGKFEQIILSFESLRASNHKVLIFSSFVGHLKLIAAEFDRQGWKYAMLTGQTRDRESVIEQFIQTPDINCFFISLKAGGVGLNLTAADYVFIVDPWWNPAAEMQALSRAHRIGQDKNVMVYRFISSGTIEEKILQLQERKTELSSNLIASGNILEMLSPEELQSLFR